MTDTTEDSGEIERLYEYCEKLNEAKDKSLNKVDYEGIIAAANGSVKAKQLAAQMIPKFFKFFPDLSEQALDQHLYLCEDEELGVRVQAIRGLPFFCKDTPENLAKIVDILGQLLIAGDNVERDAVHKALMLLLRQDVKTSLTTLFKHIGSMDDRSAEDLSTWETIREKVLCFIRDKVFPLKAELLKPQDEMERHVANLVKQEPTRLDHDPDSTNPTFASPLLARRLQTSTARSNLIMCVRVGLLDPCVRGGACLTAGAVSIPLEISLTLLLPPALSSAIVLSVKIWHHTFTAHMANQIKRRNVSSLTYENFPGGTALTHARLTQQCPPRSIMLLGRLEPLTSLWYHLDRK
ncbi:apoptosis inhibitor 5-like [Dorcoceras hygrometricum]|uniref:Apoptosis inhibitor 5-like n=1 Tax=Dorcoceras hygrometricum TaxID=472368 RepID=A0A2Z7C9G2_9LAMI|nr:apoptosis inhibitor 5-like [Dorcoceras hygrometricum]